MFYKRDYGLTTKIKGDDLNSVITQWAEWFIKRDRLIHHTKLKGATVTTVFMGIDYQFFGYQSEKPLIFETSVKDGVMDGYILLASTAHEAMENHIKVVNQAFAKKFNDTSFFPWADGR